MPSVHNPAPDLSVAAGESAGGGWGRHDECQAGGLWGCAPHLQQLLHPPHGGKP